MVEKTAPLPLWKRVVYSLLPTLMLLAGMEAGGRLLLARGYRFEMIIRKPPVGLALTPGWHGNYHGAWVRISSQGFRDDEISPTKIPGEYRIIVIGDSRTFGFGVTQEQIYPQQLEHLLAKHYPERPITVLNAGVPGCTSREALRFVETQAFEFDPDLIIVAVGHNDRWTDEKKTDTEVSPTVVQRTDSLKHPGTGVVTLLRAAFKPLDDRLEMMPWYYETKNRLAVKVRSRLRPVGKRDWSGVDFDHVVPLNEYKRNLAGLIALARERDVGVVLLNLEENPDIYVEAGIALYKRGSFDEAQGDFEAVIEGYQMNFSPLPYYYLGLIAKQKGETETAERCLLLAELGAKYFPLAGIAGTVNYWQAAGLPLLREHNVVALGQMPAIVNPRGLFQEYSKVAHKLAVQPGVWAVNVDETVLQRSMFLAGDVCHPNAAGNHSIATKLFHFLVTHGLVSALSNRS